MDIEPLGLIEEFKPTRTKRAKLWIIRFFLSLSNGFSILWELLFTGFIQFINSPVEVKEVSESQFLRQSLAVALITTLIGLKIYLGHPNNYYLLGFLIYQTLRGISFLGMINIQPVVPNQEKEPVSYKGARRQFRPRRDDDLLEEEGYDNSDYGELYEEQQ